MAYEYWGDYIHDKRTEKEIGLRTFCRELGIDPSNWSKIERNIADPPKDLRVLKNIIKLLELTNLESFRYWLLLSNYNMPRKTESIYDKLPLLLSGKKDVDMKKLFELIEKS